MFANLIRRIKSKPAAARTMDELRADILAASARGDHEARERALSEYSRAMYAAQDAAGAAA